MSVPSTTNFVQYTLSTNPQALSVPFVFTNASDLLVVDSKTSPPTVLTLNSDYSVSGGSGSIGTVTTIAGGANGVLVGDVITISRAVPITQPTGYTNTGSYTPSMVGASLDKLTEIAQQLDLDRTRSLRFQKDETLDGTLPSKSARSGNALTFDANGLPIASVPVNSVFGSFFAQASSVSAMRGTSFASAGSGALFELLGYYAAGDGGGGLFYVDKTDTTTAEDGIFVFVASDGTRIKAVHTTSIDIRQAGAKCDFNGSTGTDNTSRVQAAINALTVMAYPASPGVLTVSGRCFCASGLTITNKSITIKCVNGGELVSNVVGTFITVGQASYISDPATGYYQVNFNDCVIRKTNTTGVTVDNIGVKTVRFFRSYISGGATTIQSAGSFAGFSIRKSRIQGGLNYGVRLLTQNNISDISSNQILGTGTVGIGLQIEAAGGLENSGIIAYNNDFEGWSNGIKVTASTSGVIENVNIDDNWFETIASYSIIITNESGDAYKRGINITRNAVASNAGDIIIGSNAAGTAEIQGKADLNYIPASNITVQGTNITTFRVGLNFTQSGTVSMPSAPLSNTEIGPHYLMPRFAVAPSSPWGNGAGGLAGEQRWENGRIFQKTASDGWYQTQIYKINDATTLINLPTGTTPSVTGLKITQTANGGATSLTKFLNGYIGQELTLLNGDGGNTTIVHNASFIITKTAANVALTGDKVITFVCRDGTKWYEV